MQESLFARAARVFDGWVDPETGVSVLRIHPPGVDMYPGRFMTPYHQTQPFLDGGRRILLRQGKNREHAREGASPSVMLDLTTGVIDDLLFAEGFPVDLNDRAQTALLYHRRGESGAQAILYDLQIGRALASLEVEADWHLAGGILLADGKRAVISHSQGKPYDEFCRTHFHLLAPGGSTVFLELEGIHGNHMQGCPTDPDLFAYNAWPTPRWDIEGVTSIAKVDGSVNYYAPLDDNAPRPGDFFGVRDHYVWTPDGARIVSYLNRQPVDLSAPFNHFEFDWWLSALDWRTGEDYFAQYPLGRWGGHMQVTPDSRYILCGGGPGFDKLFAVDLQALKEGWNEHIICGYPTTVSRGVNSDPFPYPFALPDGSGVIFNAGWPGDEFGVYLAEWPGELR